MGEEMKLETFGRVFVPPSSDSEEGYVQLEGAVFSNLNFEWYTSTDDKHDIHSRMKDFSRNEVWLRSNVTALNKEENEETYTLQVLLPSPLKAGTFPGPTLEYFQEFRQREMKMATEYGLLDSSNETELKRFSRSQGILAFLLSEQSPALSSPMVLYLAMFIHADDLLDESDDLKSSAVSSSLRQLGYAKLRPLMAPLLAAISLSPTKPSAAGNGTHKTDVSSFSINGMDPNNARRLTRFLDGMTSVLKDWRQEMMRVGGDDEFAAHPLLSSITQMYEASLFEICAEAQTISKQVAPALGNLTCAIWMVLETLALSQSVRLAPEIRSSFMFRWWLDQLATHHSKMNDLLSYPKEQIAGHGKQVYALHMAGMSLPEAVEKVQTEANEAMRNVVMGTRLLKRMWGEGPEGQALSKYLDIGTRLLMSTLQCVGCLPRYQEMPLSWDCVVKTTEWPEDVKFTARL